MSAPATTAESAGDVASLYAEHHGWLRHWLRARLGNACDAADLANDTFVRILANRRRQHWGEEPRALLTHIAKGLVIDHWRRAEVERAYLEALAHRPEAEAPSPETRLLVLQTLQRVDALLRAMPARTREIFLLAQLDGLGYAAIAAQLRTLEVTVKRHMRKAFVACLAAA